MPAASGSTATNVYDLDGAFIKGLAETYGDDNWKMYDDDGKVIVTETAEEFEGAARPDVDPSLQNHCVAGQARMARGRQGDPDHGADPGQAGGRRHARGDAGQPRA